MEGGLDSPPFVLDTGEPSLRSPCRYDGVLAKKRIAGLLDKLFIVPTLPRHCH